MMITRATVCLLLVVASSLLADGVQDNIPAQVRPIPPVGIAVPDAIQAELVEGVAELERELAVFRQSGAAPAVRLLPDVQIYLNAVRYALTYNEFFKENEFGVARAFLGQGRERLGQLKQGQAPWRSATGLVVRGYLSRIDGSVQPYGLVVPAGYQPGQPHRFRLDTWFHGRGETLTELAFINDRQRSPGQFVPRDAFVLHLYGRYSNGSKFAGETDLFEALEAVRADYPIDENRLAVRGFSLGGASAWHLAVHHAGMWAAAAPGAGFAETPEFLKSFQQETLNPTWYEKKLWHLYDATDYAVNLFNLPTVAYSGELDRQKQAADIMAAALAEEGIELTHIIGPQTAHKYHPDAQVEIDRRVDSIMARGRNPVPRRVRFTTWTLRYNEMLWVTVDAMEEHWERARVEAEMDGERTVRIRTGNVAGLTLSFGAGLCPLDAAQVPEVILDGRTLSAPRVGSDRSWEARFVKAGDGWRVAEGVGPGAGLRKRHGLQGPIDDAFMESFLMVQPTGRGLSERVDGWVAAELTRATNEWRRHFRGEARVKRDVDVTDADIASHNLVLWGDPKSNRIMERVVGKLPVSWGGEGVRVGGAGYGPEDHALILIHPNPLNPERYVVLNSGFTFREFAYLNNARQVPMLPDYAVVDLRTPPGTQFPGKVVDGGFFGEEWELKK